MIGSISEKRKRTRLPVRPLEPASPSGPVLHRVVDISPFGCLLESRESLGDVASALRLSLPLPKGACGKPLTARIVWKKERGQGVERGSGLYGLRFEEADEASRRALRLYIDFLRRDRHLAGVDEAWRRLAMRRSGHGSPVADVEFDAPVLSR